MNTLLVVLLGFILYSVVIFAFLRFFGYLSDRDAEIRKLLGNRQTRRKLRSSISKRRLKLAR